MCESFFFKFTDFSKWMQIRLPCMRAVCLDFLVMSCKMELTYIVIAVVIFALLFGVIWYFMRDKIKSYMNEKCPSFNMGGTQKLEFSDPIAENMHSHVLQQDGDAEVDFNLDVNVGPELILSKKHRSAKSVPTATDYVRYTFQPEIKSASVNFYSRKVEMNLKIYSRVKLLAELIRDGRDLIVKHYTDDGVVERIVTSVYPNLDSRSIYLLDLKPTEIGFNHRTVLKFAAQPITSIAVHSTQLKSIYLRELTHDAHGQEDDSEDM